MRFSQRFKTLVLAIVSGIFIAYPLEGSAMENAGYDAAFVAKHILEETGLHRGIVAVLGVEDKDLALEIARMEDFLVQILDSRLDKVEKTKVALDVDGLYGKYITVAKADLNPLPYADRTIDLLLSTHLTTKSLDEIKAVEIMRALCPQGKAVLGFQTGDNNGPGVDRIQQWLRDGGARDYDLGEDHHGVFVMITKPPLAGADDWTHWEHRPDNNPVSTDTVIQAPYMTQWMGEPYYIAMPAVTTSAGGRIFLAMGHIAHHKREEPWLNTLIARNGFNGTILWNRKLPDGYLAHRSAYVATDKIFYMIDTDGNGCLLLDAKTGEERGRITVPEARGEWKWMAIQDGILYALAGKQKDPSETTVVRSEYTHWSWGELSKGYYQPRVPWGFGQIIAAYDLKQEKTLWTHEEAADIDSRAMALGDGKLYFYGPDSHAACLDAQTGHVQWMNDDPELRRLIEEPGQGLGSTPGFRTTCFCLYTPRALFFEAQTRMNIVGVSLEDGSLLWSHRKTTNNPNMIYIDGQLLCGIGPDGNTMVIDPMTGEIVKDLQFKKRSCARLTATPDSFFCRGWIEGLTRYDREDGSIMFNGAFRPSCNDGVIGTNGLLYLGPWACDCNLSLMGRIALCSAGDFQFEREVNVSERLERGQGELSIASAFSITDKDWFTYRGNNNRTASTSVRAPESTSRIWEFNPSYAFTPAPPVAAGGLIFLAGDDGKVRAIDAVTGQPKWTYRTAGPIQQPPSIWKGRAYVGSGDGYVYALEAATGRLLWRFRAAPVERRIPVYGSISSTWPVHSGVVVQDGIAYAAAGIIDYDGTYVYALDAESGKVIWQNNSSGHLNPELRKGVSAQGVLAIANNYLWMPGGNVVSPAAYDIKTGAYAGLYPKDGSPQTNRGEEIGVLGEDYIITGGRLRYSAGTNVVNPGVFTAYQAQAGSGIGGGKTLNSGKIPPAWNDRMFAFVNGRKTVPAVCKAKTVLDHLKGGSNKQPNTIWNADALQNTDTLSLAMTPNAVVAVYEAPNFRSLYPRWEISALGADDGDVLWKHKLSSEALVGGLLIDRDGRIVAAMKEGRLACYGDGKAAEEYLNSIISMADGSEENKNMAIRFLKDAFRSNQDPEDRERIIQNLKKLGYEVGKEAKEAGFVIHWNLIGPFPWNENNPTDKVLIEEPFVNLSKTYKPNRRELKWKDYITDHPTGKVDLARIYGDYEGVAVYAYAEVNLPESKEIYLKIGSNDGFKCWFNGKEAGRFDGGRTYMPDQDTLKVQAKKGVNNILLKITQQGSAWAFGIRLTEVSGAPIGLMGE